MQNEAIYTNWLAQPKFVKFFASEASKLERV